MILSAALPLFWATTSAAPVADYTIEAEIGFDGNVKIGYSVPVGVTVTNNSDENFKGKVSIPVMSNREYYIEEIEYTSYSRSVEIAPGGSITTEINVPINYIDREISVELIDGKKTVATTQASVNVTAEDNCWVGVISNNADELFYLKSDTYSTSTDVKVVDLTGSLYTDTADLSCFNIFVVNDFDFASVNNRQMQKIKQRINQGATMLVGNGGYIGSVDRLGLSDREYTEYGIGMNDSSYKSYQCGNGSVVLADIDLSDYNDFVGYVSPIYANAVNNTEVSNYANLKQSFINQTDTIPDFSDNTIDVIMVVIYIYIAFIPVLYFVLKRKDKREKALKIIPAAALGICVVIYLLSFNTVYKKPLASVINHISLDDTNAEDTAVDTYMNIISPSKGDITIVPEGNPVLCSIPDQRNSYYNGSATTYTEKSKVINEITLTGQETIIKLGEKTKWENTYLALLNTTQLSGSIEGENISVEDSVLKGQIKNNTGYDFADAIIAVKSVNGLHYLECVKDFNSGDSVDLSQFGINPQTLGVKNFYEYEDKIYPNRYNHQFRESSEDVYKYNMKLNIASTLLHENNMTATQEMNVYGYTDRVDFNSLNVYVIGYNFDELYGSDTEVNNKKLKAAETNVFSKGFAVDVKQVVENIEMPTYHIAETTVLTPYSAEINNNMLYIYDKNEYVELSLKNKGNYSFAVEWFCDANEVLIYNNISGMWDEFEIYQMYDPYYYADAYGDIRIKATGFNSDEIPLPTICFEGVN